MAFPLDPDSLGACRRLLPSQPARAHARSRRCAGYPARSVGPRLVQRIARCLPVASLPCRPAPRAPAHISRSLRSFVADAFQFVLDVFGDESGVSAELPQSARKGSAAHGCAGAGAVTETFMYDDLLPMGFGMSGGQAAMQVAMPRTASWTGPFPLTSTVIHTGAAPRPRARCAAIDTARAAMRWQTLTRSSLGGALCDAAVRRAGRRPALRSRRRRRARSPRARGCSARGHCCCCR